MKIKLKNKKKIKSKISKAINTVCPRSSDPCTTTWIYSILIIVNATIMNILKSKMPGVCSALVQTICRCPDRPRPRSPPSPRTGSRPAWRSGTRPTSRTRTLHPTPRLKGSQARLSFYPGLRRNIPAPGPRKKNWILRGFPFHMVTFH